jgi:hypothetical protein
MAGEVTVRFVLDNQALDELLRGPDGPVYESMLRRADNLQRAAEDQIPYGTGDPGPYGHLRGSLTKRIYGQEGSSAIEVWVGSEHPRALLHHEGTRPHTIIAHEKQLHFEMDGIEVFARRVNHPGTKPNRYLTDNLEIVTEDEG